MDKINQRTADSIIQLFDEMGSQQAEWQREKGWAEEGDTLREIREDMKHYPLPKHPIYLSRSNAALRNYYISKLALIATEVAEAIEEIRDGREIGERYYSATFSTSELAEDGYPAPGPDKPEGVLSELADIIIRVWSLAGEAGLPLGEAVVEKLNYNSTRVFRHGGKVI
jgi:hypothetical protein